MDYSFLIILALAFGAMWLMTSRTRKQQKEAANFRASLAPGQEVMTGSGLFGTVVDVEGDIVTLETSPGVTSRWLRPAIAKLVDPPVADELEAEDADDELDDDELYEDELYEDEVDETTDADATLQVPDDASSLTEGRDDEGTTRR
ncbi:MULTISPECIES: preprotein translocase subunit YajC [unclassified Actinotalea]|uniref:preprotein translocase subunit YajC n=1 Tax=unclassified Actinotalea TaxID=2638618 RepID=UPI0015F7010C|nr:MULTISPECIES: preprotein translocase subunit YajC [unclassified Actinotalea]